MNLHLNPVVNNYENCFLMHEYGYNFLKLKKECCKAHIDWYIYVELKWRVNADP